MAEIPPHKGDYMNPFEVKESKKNEYYNFKNLFLKSYDKKSLDPYSKTRIILMNGTEFESNWFYHQFARHCRNNDIRIAIAKIRRVEQQQQKRIASLKPINESILETTLSYEQLAVDLTAILAQSEKNETVKKQLDFALLEDFDHLYRFTDMLYNDEKQNYKDLIGSYTEITVGRPTIAEHRPPEADLKTPVNFCLADLRTKLNVSIIIAAEQQTMNYYMNVANFYHTEWGRKMYGEIAMIEEEHVSGYESLKDPTTTWLECALMHEYAECYLYYSCYKTEKNEYLKSVYEEHFLDEVNHLKIISELLKKYDGKDFFEVMPETEFPDILNFKENKSYIREVLKSVPLTTSGDVYINVNDLKPNNAFKKYQSAIIKGEQTVPSHRVMENYIKKHGEDLRYETAPHPIKELRDRKVDNVSVARP